MKEGPVYLQEIVSKVYVSSAHENCKLFMFRTARQLSAQESKCYRPANQPTKDTLVLQTTDVQSIGLCIHCEYSMSIHDNSWTLQ